MKPSLKFFGRFHSGASITTLACFGIFIGCGDSGQLPDAGVDARAGGKGGGAPAGKSGGGAGAGGVRSELGGGPGTGIGGTDGDGGIGGAVAGRGGGGDTGVAGGSDGATSGGGQSGGEHGTAGHGEGGWTGGSGAAGGLAGGAAAAGGLAAGGMVQATAGSDGTAGAGMTGQPMAGAPALGGSAGGLGGSRGVGGAGGMGGAGGAAGVGGPAGMPGQAGASGMGGAGGSCPGGTVSLDGALTCQKACAGLDSDSDGVDDCMDSCPTDPTRWRESCGVGPSHIDLTWMTVTNIYAEVGRFNFIIDGYVTRIPHSNFYGGGGGLQNTHSPSVPNVTAVSQVLDALGGAGKVNLLLTGHSHFDHSFDTATWSFLTGAPIIGSRSTCYQAMAQGIADSDCTEVLGGERIRLSPGLTMRVIRWNHSGDASNPEQHLPVELGAVPIPDPVTGGLRAGVSEDFPNGGGGRAYLFTVDGVDGPYSWLFTNSAGYVDLDVPIVIDGFDYGAPLENLKAAMSDAKLDRVDLWVGAGGDPVAQLVLPVLRPKAYLPVHWDNFYAAFLSHPMPYSDSALTATLAAQGISLITPVQVMDKWRLDRNGVRPIANDAVKGALNLQ